jgi:crotonobetainyl-CoA:carnitine CoA-transferase CaiB-like acyl-CoA transferase
LRFSDTPVQHVRPPLLSEHTDAVLTGLLGRSPEQVAALRKAGIV